MLNAFKNSFLGCFCIFIINAYKNSLLCRNVSKVAEVWKASCTYSIIHNYTHKNPVYEYSLFHRFFESVFALVNKVFRPLGDWLVLSGKNSFTAKCIKDTAPNFMTAFCITALGISLGSCFYYPVAGICAVVFFGVFTGISLVKGAFENCFIYRFICWLVRS